MVSRMQEKNDKKYQGTCQGDSLPAKRLGQPLGHIPQTLASLHPISVAFVNDESKFPTKYGKMLP